MGVQLIRLADSDRGALTALWQAADDARRRQLGLAARPAAAPALARPGAFGVGVFEGPSLVSVALAMPARADDARSRHNVPGLAHISTVATAPYRWGQGLAGTALAAVVSHTRRRGFARVQLWTHRSNTGAQRLYQRHGFLRSGRERVDDRGEPIVHYLHDVAALPVRSRPAARLVCLDPADRILLIHHRDPVDGHQLWEPPGGGIEFGETTRDAVVREWVEETGLPLPGLVGEPVGVARDLFWHGARWVGDEQFFGARIPSAARSPSSLALTADEQTSYLGASWIGWRDLDTQTDPVVPDLVPVLTRLIPDGPWSAQLTVGTPD